MIQIPWISLHVVKVWPPAPIVSSAKYINIVHEIELPILSRYELSILIHEAQEITAGESSGSQKKVKLSYFGIFSIAFRGSPFVSLQ
jgi:hypothetical protein